MPKAAFLTWLQLRALTWCGPDIPPFSIQVWVDLTGTSRSTLIRHLNCLQKLNALQWHSPEPGTVSVSFKSALYPAQSNFKQGAQKSAILKLDRTKMDQPKMDCPKMDCSKLDSSPSLNPHSSSSRILVLEPGNQESSQIRRDEVEGEGQRDVPAVSHVSRVYFERYSRLHCEGERGKRNIRKLEHSNVQTFQPSNPQPCERYDIPSPVSIYRSLAHLTPNHSQRRILCSAITDLPLWQGTLEHWLMHGWNPRNVTGMLELYTRGGAAGCRYCQSENSSRRGPKTAQEYTHDALEDLRRELDNPHDQL